MPKVLFVGTSERWREHVASACIALCDLDQATSGEEALARIHGVEAFIVDVASLGDDAGFRFVKTLRARDPGAQIILVGVAENFDVARRAMALGVVDIFANDAQPERLHSSIAQGLVSIAAARTAEAHNSGIAAHLANDGELLGNSAAIVRVRELIESVSGNDRPVLILGESGVGKGQVAKALHRRGRFPKGPFVPVNVPTLRHETLTSELFGHVRGAFTSADHAHMGAFERAHQGTIFLDEVSEMTPEVQATFLLVIDNKQVMRFGGETPVIVDTRILAATNKNPDELVRSGRLRPDLFHRLKHSSIEVPPLRYRRDDIALLANKFLQDYLRETAKPPMAFDDPALARLSEYGWPGNVRELKNVVEHLADLGKEELIDADLVGTALGVDVGSEIPSPFDFSRSLPEREREFRVLSLKAALEKSGGNYDEAARVLGVPRTTLRSQVESAGIISAKHKNAAKRVLIIDDEPRFLEAFGICLEQEYEVTKAIGAYHALEVLAKNADFAHVVCDIKLADLPARELLALVAAQKISLKNWVLFTSYSPEHAEPRAIAEAYHLPVLDKARGAKALRRFLRTNGTN